MSAAPSLTLVVDLDAARPELEDGLSRAELLNEQHRYEEALDALNDMAPISSRLHDLSLRALFAESWARMYLGELQLADALLERARALAETPALGGLARAEALFRLGACRLKLSRTAEAVALLTLALELCEREGGPPGLRAHVLVWRARAYQLGRDWGAARIDVERALELGEAAGEPRMVAQGYFQASLVAEREGQWLLARFYAEQARALFEQLGDRLNVGRLTNNLGGLSFLVGEVDAAGPLLSQAYAIAREVGSDTEAGRALSSLAQVELRTGEPLEAERHARSALALLAGQPGAADEIGNAQLVLARALLDQGRLDEAEASLDAAEAGFERLGSLGERVAVSVARGDLAAARGDAERAAAVYRAAAEALQDFHF